MKEAVESLFFIFHKPPNFSTKRINV